MVHECSVSNRINIPVNWSEDRKASAAWFLGFMRIRQLLSILNLDSTSLNRTAHQPLEASVARQPKQVASIKSRNLAITQFPAKALENQFPVSIRKFV